MKRFVFQGFGQTDHSRSDLLAAYSSAPDGEENHFPLEVSGGLDLRARPMISPVDVLGGSFDLCVILVGACREGQASSGEEYFDHGKKVVPDGVEAREGAFSR